VRDSPYVDLPSTGSTMTAADRSRLSKQVRVRFGDVATDNEVGHLAIGSPRSGQIVTRSRKGRLYDWWWHVGLLGLRVTSSAGGCTTLDVTRFSKIQH